MADFAGLDEDGIGDGDQEERRRDNYRTSGR